MKGYAYYKMRLNCEVNKKVSVITPVYNSERFLSDMIDSVCNQT